jgi:hypothetical protein
MGRFRFSIASLIGVVGFAATAALRASTDAWESGILGFAWLFLLTAVLLAVHRTESRRAFWLGVALFGWAYLIASLIPPLGLRLPTTLGLAFIDSRIPGREKLVSTMFLYTTGGESSFNTTVSPYSSSPVFPTPSYVRIWDPATGKILTAGGATENFIRIGHSLLALLLAFLGGHLSRYLYRRGRAESVPSAVGSSPAT